MVFLSSFQSGQSSVEEAARRQAHRNSGPATVGHSTLVSTPIRQLETKRRIMLPVVPGTLLLKHNPTKQFPMNNRLTLVACQM